jgi:hypothetical protein
MRMTAARAHAPENARGASAGRQVGRRPGEAVAARPVAGGEQLRPAAAMELQRAAGNAAVTRMIQRAGRPSNPNRPAQDVPGTTITAHHVVQYELLSDYFDRPGIMAKFVPQRKDISLSQLSNLNLIPLLDRLDLGSLGRPENMGQLSAVAVADNNAVPEKTREALKSAIAKVLQAGKNPAKGGEEVLEIAKAFFAWAPANLFHGPAPQDRDWDPDGPTGWDAPDTDAQYFLAPDHYGTLARLRSVLAETKGNPPKQVDPRAVSLFNKLAADHNTVTPYNPASWKAGASGHLHPGAREARPR